MNIARLCIQYFLIIGFVCMVTVNAETIIVDTYDDTNETNVCSIRSAIIAANTDSVFKGCIAGENGMDTIKLKGGQYALRDNLPRITDSLSIVGKGQDLSDGTVIYASVFGVNQPIYFQPSSLTGKTLLLKGLHIRDGVEDRGHNGGGCVDVRGSHTVTLDHVTLRGCMGRYGGGLRFATMASSTGTVGTLNILWSKITENNFLGTDDYSKGGGVYVVDAVNFNMENSMIRGNYAGVAGGGIAIVSEPTTMVLASDINITRSVIRSNVVNSSTQASKGGALYIWKDSSYAQPTVDVSISHSSIISNYAEGVSPDSGGIYLEGGSAIHADLYNTFLHTNDTLLNPSINYWANWNFTIKAGVIVSSSGYNAIGHGSYLQANSWTSPSGSPNQNHDYVSLGLFQEPLEDNGNCPNEKYDYRGYARPIYICDIGAYENNSMAVVDYDGDGVVDEEDAFPLDAKETVDTDGDYIGNNADTDDDNDGVADFLDAFPLDATESVDTDGDGIGNNADTDDDNDGVADFLDAFPLDATESVDTDGDGIGNNADTDDDGDGYSDTLELSEGSDPLDVNSKPLDTDNDGIPNSTDTDDDGDGYSDTLELSEGSDPLDVNSKPLDTDNDGIPNSTDTDDDNDGISDTDEATLGFNPLDASDGLADSDGDGFSNTMEFSIGTNMNDVNDKPIWTPILMGEIMIFVPAKAG